MSCTEQTLQKVLRNFTTATGSSERPPMGGIWAQLVSVKATIREEFGGLAFS